MTLIYLGIIVGVAYCLGLVYWIGQMREWWDWLNPRNLNQGIIDGRIIRQHEEMDRTHAERKDNAAPHQPLAKASSLTKARFEPINLDTRRVWARLHTADQLEGTLGVITGAASPPDAEYIRRYGLPKTVTLKTLEKLIEARKAGKDAEFESGF